MHNYILQYSLYSYFLPEAEQFVDMPFTKEGKSLDYSHELRLEIHFTHSHFLCSKARVCVVFFSISWPYFPLSILLYSHTLPWGIVRDMNGTSRTQAKNHKPRSNTGIYGHVSPIVLTCSRFPTYSHPARPPHTQPIRRWRDRHSPPAGPSERWSCLYSSASPSVPPPPSAAHPPARGVTYVTGADLRGRAGRSTIPFGSPRHKNQR